MDRPELTYGKYGMMRKRYLKDHKPELYSSLLLSGSLNGHLAKIDALARTYVEEFMKVYLEAHPAPDKTTRQMEWVGYMNSVKAMAEEAALERVVYGGEIQSK